MTEQDRRDWFDRLYEKYYRLLYSHAGWKIECFGFPKGMIDELAHDAVQMTFAAAWEKANLLISIEKPGAWLMAVLKNKLIDLVRDEIRMADLRSKLELCLQAESPTDLQETEFRLFLEGTLTEDEQELIKRIYINSEKPSHVCEDMGLKRSALSMRLRRIKKKLIKYLDL